MAKAKAVVEEIVKDAKLRKYRQAVWRRDGALGALMIRGRRHPVHVRVGDSIDSWQVVGVEECRRLTLLFGMKAPGAGALEFELEPLPEGVRVRATAYFHPAGFAGLLYWWSLFLPHLVIFDGLTRAIARRAEAAEAGRLASS